MFTLEDYPENSVEILQETKKLAVLQGSWREQSEEWGEGDSVRGGSDLLWLASRLQLEPGCILLGRVKAQLRGIPARRPPPKQQPSVSTPAPRPWDAAASSHTEWGRPQPSRRDTSAPLHVRSTFCLPVLKYVLRLRETGRVFYSRKPPSFTFLEACTIRAESCANFPSH